MDSKDKTKQATTKKQKWFVKRSLSNVIFCLFHETKARETRQERTTKNKEAKKKEEGQTNKKQETRKFERDRERERTKKEKRKSERSQGERKGDTEKWTKNNPLSVGKQCFCKKTKRTPPPPPKKEGLKANCPKTHVQGGVAPNPKKNAHKRRKTPKQKEEGVKRSTWSSAETGLEKKTRTKTRKALRTAAARPFLAMTPTHDRRPDTPASPLRVKFARAHRTKMRKNALFQTSSVLQPQGFFTL